MKRFEISKLMDEYVDNEFFPDGGSTADAEAVKNKVLAKATPAKRRRTMPLKGVLIAAALMAVLVLSAVAADIPTKVYQMVSGDSMIIQTDPTGKHYLYIDWQTKTAPIVLEDGRLWLELDDGRIDVTDLIDEETPYILEGEDPDSGLKSYLIVGGTPEDYGWFQWMEMPLGGYNGGGWNSYTDYYDVEGELIDVNEWDAENRDSDYKLLPGISAPKIITIDKPWYLNADAQLGLWD